MSEEAVKRRVVRPGQCIGELVVMCRDVRRPKGVWWQCSCSCGDVSSYRSYWLRKHPPKGIRPRRRCDRCEMANGTRVHNTNVRIQPGSRFGKLTVCDRVEGHKSFVRCRCDCGREQDFYERALQPAANGTRSAIIRDACDSCFRERCRVCNRLFRPFSPRAFSKFTCSSECAKKSERMREKEARARRREREKAKKQGA